MPTIHDHHSLDGGTVSSTDSVLLPDHLIDLRRSGLSDEQIRQCRFYSSSDSAQVGKWLGWNNSAKRLGPCLCIPFFDTDGKQLDYVRVKPDHPRTSEDSGKRVKYESPKGKASRAYFPPGTRTAVADASIPLIVTEGEKKAAKADQEGFPCVGLVGVYGWQKAGPKNPVGKSVGPREFIPDLNGVHWMGRKVYIAYDSDLIEKPQVRWAEWHLSEAFRKVGAIVFAIRIPHTASGEKQGLDDFLAVAGPAALRDLIGAARPVVKPELEPRSDSVPEILIGTDEHRVNEEACQALGGESSVYQRGGSLVQIIEQETEPEAAAVVRRPVGSVSIRALPKPLLRECLTRCVRWRKLGKDGETVEDTHPPYWAVDAIYARANWPSVQKLTAVVPHPVVLGDGTILGTNGFHSDSGLYISMPAGLTVSVPDRPSCNDMKAAVAELLDVVHDFPFEATVHRSAWLASLLTPLAWFAFNGQSPMFLIDGNVRGVGKGLLADVVALIVTGRRFPVMSYTNDKEELRKKITTLAAEGERLVLLDNLAGAVGNEVLERALTTDTWKDRLLGVNKDYDGPLNVVWFATGNNVQFVGDTPRRVCHIRLETHEERPETKEGFRYSDLRSHVLRIRGRLLTAALTILRGWIVAGLPARKLSPWGSYEHWSRMVREAVVFAGLPDPGETRSQLYTMADRDAAALADIIAGLTELDHEGRGMTIAEILTRLKMESPCSEVVANMRTAIEEHCGSLCSKQLGYLLRRFANRTCGDLKIAKAGSNGKGSNRWKVMPAKLNSHRLATSPLSPSSPALGGNESGDEGDNGHGSAKENDGSLFDDNAGLSAMWH